MSTTQKLPHGSESLSHEDISPRAWLMKDQSKTSHRPNSRNTSNATSSQELAAGPSLFHWQDGRIASRSGLDHAHASLSPRQAKARGLLTSATCGPLSSGLSRSASLQLSLESKLRAKMDVNGSPEYVLTWKTWIMKSGVPICALRASRRSISGKDFGGLPTPSGTSNHGKNHVAGRLDEWGGSSNPFRGTEIGKVHCPAFEFWVMGYSEAWLHAMPQETPSCRKSPRILSKHVKKPATI